MTPHSIEKMAASLKAMRARVKPGMQGGTRGHSVMTAVAIDLPKESRVTGAGFAGTDIPVCGTRSGR